MTYSQQLICGLISICFFALFLFAYGSGFVDDVEVYLAIFFLIIVFLYIGIFLILIFRIICENYGISEIMNLVNSIPFGDIIWEAIEHILNIFLGIEL